MLMLKLMVSTYAGQSIWIFPRVQGYASRAAKCRESLARYQALIRSVYCNSIPQNKKNIGNAIDGLRPVHNVRKGNVVLETEILIKTRRNS